jgi:hypothetical protein
MTMISSYADAISGPRRGKCGCNCANAAEMAWMRSGFGLASFCSVRFMPSSTSAIGRVTL